MEKSLGHLAVSLFAILALSSCASTTNSVSKSSPQRLSDVLLNDQIISLPYEVFGKGVFTVNVETDIGRSFSFMIDTGATKSALYRSALKKLGVEHQGQADMMVHGINANGARPVVTVPQMKFGTHVFENFEVIVLEDRLDANGNKIKPVGLIGMDVLAQYRIYVDANERRFNLIPKDIPSPRLPSRWETVNLIENPFKDQDHGLHFMEIRMGNHLLPALLDSGAEDNMMNWSISKYPQLKRARKRLYEEWVVEGAVGSFDPRYLVRTQNIRSGQKYWDESEFLVVDFDGLGILGIKEQPFLIAGSPLLAEQSFYIDFAENIMKFKPPRTVARGRTLTSRNTVYDENNLEQ